MKRIFYLIVSLFIVASCFGDGPSYQKSYTLNVTFEYPDSYYSTIFTPDSLWFDKEAGAGIGYNDMAFFEKLNSSKTELLGGWMLSYQEMPSAKKVVDDEEEEGSEEDPDVKPEVLVVDKTYRAYLDSTSTKRNTYVVFKETANMPDHDVQFMMAEYGTCVVESCTVTNTLEVAEAVAANFEKGEKLIVKASGFISQRDENGKIAKDANGKPLLKQTGTAQISLAEFSAQKDSIVSKWTTFDLTALGSVEYIDFEVLVETDKEGMVIPNNFCMDNLVSSINIEY